MTVSVVFDEVFDGNQKLVWIGPPGETRAWLKEQPIKDTIPYTIFIGKTRETVTIPEYLELEKAYNRLLGKMMLRGRPVDDVVKDL